MAETNALNQLPKSQLTIKQLDLSKFKNNLYLVTALFAAYGAYTLVQKVKAAR